MKIKIMCTSTGCIEYAPERYRNLGIDIIRIHVNFNGKEYLEGLDLEVAQRIIDFTSGATFAISASPPVANATCIG